jgi:hypothetical protein
VTPAQSKLYPWAALAAVALAPVPAMAAKEAQGVAFSVSRNIQIGNEAFPAAPPADGATQLIRPTAEISGSTVLTFDGFDPSRGTLRSVRLYLDSRQSLDGGGSLVGTGSPSAGIIEVDPVVFTRFLVGGQQYGVEGTLLRIDSGAPAPTCSMTALEPACLFNRTSQEDFDVDLLVGPLDVFLAPTVTVALPYLFTMRANFTSFGVRPNFRAATDFDWSGDVILTYDYLPGGPGPGGVPEPSAWLLLIAGFGIAGSALRRRVRAQTASGPDATRFTALR